MENYQGVIGDPCSKEEKTIYSLKKILKKLESPEKKRNFILDG